MTGAEGHLRRQTDIAKQLPTRWRRLPWSAVTPSPKRTPQESKDRTNDLEATTPTSKMFYANKRAVETCESIPTRDAIGAIRLTRWPMPGSPMIRNRTVVRGATAGLYSGNRPLGSFAARRILAEHTRLSVSSKASTTMTAWSAKIPRALAF